METFTRQDITQKFMLESSCSIDFKQAIAKIIQRDHLTLLFDLVEAIWKNDEELAKSLLKTLGVLDHVFNSWLITRVTHNGNVELVKLMFNAGIIQDIKLLIKLINTSMHQRRSELLEWYLSNIPCSCMDSIFLNCEIVPVILKRYTDIIEILLKHGYPRDEIEQIIELFDLIF